MPYGYNCYDWRGNDEDLDPQNYDVWICDVAHTVPAWTPLFASEWYRVVPYAMVFANDFLCEPTSKGWAWRVFNGYGYITPIKVPKEEVKERQEIYKKNLGPIIEDPWGYIQRLSDELTLRYDRFKPMNVVEMRDPELAQHLWDMAELDRRMWEIHMLGWCGLLGGLRLWREMLQGLFGITQDDIRYGKLLSGFDNELFKLNNALTKLASEAVAAKLEDVFKLGDKAVISALNETESGKSWFKTFRAFLYKYGWRSNRMLDFTSPTWIEKPSLVIPEIRRIIASGAENTPATNRERLRKEGQEIAYELVSKLSSEQAAWFRDLTVCAQAAHSWAESHDFWCEFQTYGLRRRAFKELSERLSRKNVIDNPEDTAYLLHQDMVYASIYQDKIGKRYLRDKIEENKKEHLRYSEMFPGSKDVPLFLGDESKFQDVAKRDIMFSMLVPQSAGEDIKEVGATAIGCSGAPGVVEGLARVISSASEWNDIKPGEILVCPSTDGTWTPLFGMLKAIVTDSGGLLSRPAIVAREYGIPSVCGCGDVSKKIKTGDRIRVDGDQLRVYKLDKED